MNIVIAGYGVEGRSNLAYFRRRFPEATLRIADQRPVADAPDGVTVLTGERVFAQLDDADLVVRTAGLPPREIRTKGKIWSATNEFFARCPAPIIGVTGTKGKGTTCSLIASILRAAGRTVHLVGNIGVPALDVLDQIRPEDVVVYELSSFQLWDLEASPHIAVVLMIEPDHLDVHTDFGEYVAAKQHIVQHQGPEDAVVYHPTNQYAAQIAQSSASRQQRYGVADDGAAYVQANTFFVQGRAICGVDTLRIAGQHNIENACAAISAVYALDESVSNEAVAQGLGAFTGLSHRLKFVAEKQGVAFYDDSISTTPGSAIAALRAFDQPKVLILGGHDKGADYSELAQELVASDSLRGVVLVGSNAARLAALLRRAGLPEAAMVQKGPISMTGAVHAAVDLAQPGDVVILSPAAASFDQYNNYTDRGEQFVAAVAAL
ncbi:MAG: UDP-N-acetylmuramoyl-L-alanine--D-glutamate ligase [Candidatus Saccharibacteria bacterium]|nr:UDP-N-acetylmuramoyl-L-alanine--D-glutamate ligase [Candidatus Saccharibacteria bacterium]